MKRFLSLAVILSLASVSIVCAEDTSAGCENNAEKTELPQQQNNQQERPKCLVCGKRMSRTMVNRRDHSKDCKGCKGTGKRDDGRGNKITCGYCKGTGHPMKQVWVWKCTNCGK